MNMRPRIPLVRPIQRRKLDRVPNEKYGLPTHGQQFLFLFLLLMQMLGVKKKKKHTVLLNTQSKFPWSV